MWTLLLSRQGDPPGTFVDRRQLDHGQVKVGRGAATCDLVVPDTAGHLSREHCVIAAVGFDLFVTDTSTNGVALNQPNQRIAPQTPVAVRVGDRLLIGDWAIEIATEQAGLAAQLHQPMAPLAAAPAMAQPDAWFDPAPAGDPFWGGDRAAVHDFLGDAMHDFLAPPARGGGAGPAAAFDPPGGALGQAFSKPLLAAPLAPVAEAYAIPEDWAAPAAAARAPDPFAAPPADPFGGGAAPVPDPFAGPLAGPAAGDPFAGLAAAAPAGNDPFAAAVAGGAGHAPAPAADPFALPATDPFAAPVPAAAVDPFAGFGAMPGPSPAPADDPFAGFAASAPAADDPFAPAAAQPAAAPPPPAPPAVAGGDPDWDAFCAGAGMARADLRLSPDAMRRLGVLYRQVVLGLSDLIQDRAAFKDEFRVERTQLSFGRNNPLKHLTPVESAKLLLADPLPGFMDAEEAVRAGLEDVKKHQLALLAGVQHALRTVFERLAPAEVERVMAKAQAAKRGLLTRGVDPWSVYRTMWEALRADATANVNSVMSVAFREGYEAFLRGGKGVA